MNASDKVNILLVDDQPAKLLSYEVILGPLNEALIKASSAKEALHELLRNDIGVILIDVCMPDLDGFELALMIREHPRFQGTPIIFVSAIYLSDFDRLKGYEAGAVDYVPVPVIPDVLRAKVRVFADLHRKTRQLEQLNEELERRVAERTAALEASAIELRQSEQRRSLALAAGSMGSWEWNSENDIHQWDENQFRVCGVDPRLFTPDSRNVLQLVHSADRRKLRQTLTRAIKNGEPFEIEIRIVRPDGENRWCIIWAAPTREGDRSIQLTGVTYDISQRKAAEDALHRLNEELELRVDERTREREQALAQLFEAQKMDTIGQLTGGVAHDFNNLLMAILGSLELLRKRLPDDARAKRLVDNAVQGAERGAALTQRLLAFARRQELRPEIIAIPNLFFGMEDLLQRAVGPAVAIVKDLPSELASVRADSNQLELALLNLMVNARDAMPQGGVLTVTARNQTVRADGGASSELSPGEYVCLSVNDNGSGMDEATLARATEPFFTTKGPGKGTGLGLSMVHGLVMQSGGRLRISSQVGAGTTVYLWLPKAQSDRTRLEPDAIQDRAFGRTHFGEYTALAYSVLVVDDDDLVRSGTAAMLEDLGHTVVEADSGAHALEVLKSGVGVDVIVTDHAMPGMSGTELANRLRQTHPNVPIVLATGYAEIPNGGEREASNLPRLSKPFSQEELAVMIAQITQNKPAAGALAHAQIPAGITTGA